MSLDCCYASFLGRKCAARPPGGVVTNEYSKTHYMNFLCCLYVV